MLMVVRTEFLLFLATYISYVVLGGYRILGLRSKSASKHLGEPDFFSSTIMLREGSSRKKSGTKTGLGIVGLAHHDAVAYSPFPHLGPHVIVVRAWASWEKPPAHPRPQSHLAPHH